MLFSTGCVPGALVRADEWGLNGAAGRDVRFYMTQKLRPSSKRNSGSKRDSVTRTDDLVTRMSELRRLRVQVKRAEAKLLSIKGAGRMTREAHPN
jgi:hypothetical protein